MNRTEAEAIVARYSYKHEQYTVVHRETAKQLLGFRYEQMIRVKNQGPTSDTIYYWNVVDYLTIPIIHTSISVLLILPNESWGWFR